jgi:hypothetical protein
MPGSTPWRGTPDRNGRYQGDPGYIAPVINYSWVPVERARQRAAREYLEPSMPSNPGLGGLISMGGLAFGIYTGGLLPALGQHLLTSGIKEALGIKMPWER